jgi:drug/metabolite transporter (DMT)-like permease
LEILSIVFASVIFLGEKLSAKEWLSASIVIIGVGIISYSPGEYILIGVLLLALHAVFLAASRVVVKAKLGDVDPAHITNYRAFFVSISSLFFAMITGSFNPAWNISLLYSTLPAIGSAVLGHILIYKAYRRLDIGKIQLIGAFSPLLILLTTFLIFGDMMTPLQLLGGASILLGVIGLVYFHRKEKAL